MTNIYSLNDVSEIMSNGFEFSIPEEIIKLIMSLSSQVGSPEYIKTPTWSKNNHHNAGNQNVTDETKNVKKRRGNKCMEVNN